MGDFDGLFCYFGQVMMMEQVWSFGDWGDFGDWGGNGGKPIIGCFC